MSPGESADSRRRLQDAAVFRTFVAAGQRLAELHVGYEQQPEFPLQRRENPDAPLNWRVEKMKLLKPGVTPSPALRAPSPPSRERAGVRGRLHSVTCSIRYNDFLTLEGIPPEAFEYRLGNRSALEWVIDQYQVSTNKRSGITNAPNHPDDPEYIVRLIGQVITVSLETVKVVQGLPPLKTA